MQLDENSMTADQLAFMRSAVAIVSMVGGADGHLLESEVETLDAFLKEAFQLFWGASIDSVDGLADNVASWIAEGDEALLEVIAEAATLPDKMRRSLSALATHVAWADDEVVEVEADLLPGIAEALNLDPYEDPDVDYLYATSGPAVDIGVYTESLRYDETEHGEHLPPEFAQAREEWVKSGNDLDSAHYKRACHLISRWYQCRFVEAQVHVSIGWTFDIDLSDGSVATNDSNESTTPSAHFQQVEAAFGGRPRLAELHVLSVDFREHPSTRPLAKSEPLQASPDVALVAVFEGRVGKKFADTQQLAKWVRDHHDLVAGRFNFQLLEGALFGAAVEVDEDDDGFGVSSISLEGGEVHVVVSVEPSRSALVDGLTKSIAESRRFSEGAVPGVSNESGYGPATRSMFQDRAATADLVLHADTRFESIDADENLPKSVSRPAPDTKSRLVVEHICELFKQDESVPTIRIVPGQNEVVALDSIGTLHFFDALSGAKIAERKPRREVRGGRIELSANGQFMVNFNGSSNHAQVWSLADRSLKFLISHDLSDVQAVADERDDDYWTNVAVVSAAFDRSGHYLYTGSDEGTVFKWRLDDGCRMYFASGHGGSVDDIAVSADGALIAVSQEFGESVLILDARDGSRLHELECPAQSMRFHPETQNLVTSSTDGQTLPFQIWNTRTGQLERTLGRSTGRGGSIADAVFSKDGKRILTNHSGAMHVWNFDDGTIQCELETEDLVSIESVSWSADDTKILGLCTLDWSGKSAGTCRVWDSGTGRVLAVLTAQSSASPPTSEGQSASGYAAFNETCSRIVTTANVGGHGNLVATKLWRVGQVGMAADAEAPGQEAATPGEASHVRSMAQNLMGGFVASMEATQTQNAGVAAYRAGDFSEAMRCYLEAAKAGGADAQHNIGQMYAFGEGVDTSWAEAVKWWSAAADQGNLAAQCKVWMALYRGHGGLPVDLQRALRYAELAAAQGDPGSQVAAERIKTQLNAGAGVAISEQENADQLDQSVGATRSAGDQAGVGSVSFGDLVDLHNRVLDQARVKSGTAVGATGRKIAEVLDAIDPRLAVAPSQPGVASPEEVGKPAEWDGNPDTLSLNDGTTFLDGLDAAAPRSLDVESMFAVGMAAGYLLAEPLPGDSPGERMVRSLMVPIEDRRFIDVLRGEKDVWPDTEAVVFSALAQLLGRIVGSTSGEGPIADNGADDHIESVKSTANLIVSVVMARIIVAERAGESWAARTKYGEIRPHLDASLPVESAQTWAEGLDALVAHHAGRRDFANLSRWWLELEKARTVFPSSLGIAREQARSLGHLLQALQIESGIADGSSGLADEYSRLFKVQAGRLLSAIQSLLAWCNSDLNIAARVGVSLSGLSKLAAGLQKEGHADALGLLPEIWRLALSLSQPDGLSQLAVKMTFGIGALVRQVFAGRGQLEWVSGVREWMETYAISSKDAAEAQELARVNNGVRTLELAAEQSPVAGPSVGDSNRAGRSGDAQPSGAIPRRMSAVPTAAELTTASTEALNAAERVGNGKINAETAKSKMSAWVDMARVAFEVLPDVHRGDLALALRMRGLLTLSVDGDVTAKSDFTECIALGRAVYDKLSHGDRVAVEARVIYSYMTSLWGLAKIELAAGRAREALILCEEYDRRRQGIPEAGDNLSADDDNKLKVHGHALLSLGKSQEEVRSILMKASLSGLMDRLRDLAKLDPS